MIKLKNVLDIVPEWQVIMLEIEFIYCEIETVTGTKNNDSITAWDASIVHEIRSDNDNLYIHAVVIPAETEEEKEQIYKEWKEG